MSTSLTPQQIQHLDQAAVDALSDVDQLAADPETTRRLTERGEAVYGFELTCDLYANGLNGWSLAAWAAFATIRLNQANRRADALLDELAEVRAKRDAYAVEMESLRAQLATANRRADGLDADLRSAQHGLTAYANQTGQPDSEATTPPVRHVLIVTEPGAWTLRHPPGCPLDCPMFALVHTALEHTDMPVGQYEVQPNGLWDRALIGDRIDTAGAAR